MIVSGCNIGGKCLLILVFAGLIASCTKNSSVDLNPNVNAANNILLAQRSMVNVVTMTLKANGNAELQANHFAVIDGATVSYSPDQYLYVFTYNWEKSPDSTIRSGKIYVDLDTALMVPGSKAVVTYKRYMEDQRYYYGIDTLLYSGQVEGGLRFTLVAPGDSIYGSDGKTIRFTARLDCFMSPDYVSTGSYKLGITAGFSGISSLGYPFSASTLEQDSVRSTCPWMYSGMIPFTVEGAECTEGQIRFPGSGSCTDSVYYDINGISFRRLVSEDYLKL